MSSGSDLMASLSPLLVACGALLGFTVFVVRSESIAVANWLSLRLKRKAVARLPERLRETKAEEWSADLDAMDGSRLARVALAASFVRAANKISAGQGATGSPAAKLKIAPIALSVNDVLVSLNPSHGISLADGQILVTFRATFRDGHASTGQISLPVDPGVEVISEALAQRFVVTPGSRVRVPPPTVREVLHALATWPREILVGLVGWVAILLRGLRYLLRR
jgi:hypothetical protein